MPYVDNLYSAFQSVGHQYTHIVGINQHDHFYPQCGEHSFIAELYHRFRLIMLAHPNNYHGLCFHFDLIKMRFGGSPDLVLHEAPNNRNRQVMFIEVKTDPGRNLTVDLGKLFLATAVDNEQEQLGFHHGIFIVGNRSAPDTSQIISAYINQNHFEHDPRLHNLYLFNFFYNNHVLEHARFTFAEIINNG